ncbi:2-isopropylmalate synthase [Breznakia blatticola]|uniref:2-isopropylmalate synthase n=1 Tax=Breznakia blatticola TaxID=1754012 RepID=A0A4R7ZTW7_9FIRM|nr:2-isopropylmalate synthase [Breznakia blatticola]TDW21016.1 2-isopropylmalate synthase [Breznakia blatticola]
MNFNKYKRGYFMPPEPCFDWVKKEYIDTAPTWCSVDLRDGNQSLIIPMSLDEKLKFFDLLVKVGFKEIEVGFPAASETEYQFLRTLIEQDLIPDDVTVQVLTQAREHIIKKTFDALDGCKKAVVHVYNSTSVAQREQVFRKSKEEILTIATNGAKLLKELAKDAKGDIRFEYSPESFTGTEMEYALEVCNAVLDIWQPTPDKKAIINLPVTVEMSMSHVYASQIEYMHKHLKHRDAVEISLHPHNDRGCGVADSELGLLAGADRIEGTLFGNGERTGNVDIVTLALNMFTHGVNPKLDFSNIQEIVRVYEEVTRMRVYDRQPYAGKLVFAAFSGSHQDAIAKGLKYREEIGSDLWNVPYLPIDPKDVGREYESDVIRINSQSGKGGIGYLMEEYYGFDLPKRFREGFGYYIKDISDKKHAELMPNEIKDIFEKDFVNLQAPLELIDYHFTRNGDISVEVEVNFKGEHKMCKGNGNGRLDAVANAFREHLGLTFDVIDYNEHSLGKSSASKACAYVEINDCVNVDRFGVGIHDDIIAASIQAMVSALNRAINEKAKIEGE